MHSDISNRNSSELSFFTVVASSKRKMITEFNSAFTFAITMKLFLSIDYKFCHLSSKPFGENKIVVEFLVSEN